MASMTEAQLDRYEAFRRSSLARPKMKMVSHVCDEELFWDSGTPVYFAKLAPSCLQLLQTLVGGRVPDKAIIALCGIGKMFVGDVVEMGKCWCLYSVD